MFVGDCTDPLDSDSFDPVQVRARVRVKVRVRVRARVNVSIYSPTICVLPIVISE